MSQLSSKVHINEEDALQSRMCIGKLKSAHMIAGYHYNFVFSVHKTMRSIV